MPFRRDNRPNFYFQARTRTGWKQLCAGTSSRPLAAKIEAMWEGLASRERAWKVLDQVWLGALTVGRLYDSWIECDRNIVELERRLDDTNIEPMVGEWHKVLKSQKSTDWAAHALTHVRALIPEDVPLLASAVTREWLTKRLAAQVCSRNTRRKIHSSWSVFFTFCTDVKSAFAFSPMLGVDRPKRELKPPRFYDIETVEAIIDWQPTEERKAYFSMVYGTGADVSPALLVRRADVDFDKHEVRIAGTKTGSRDRIVRVADWAWPRFSELAKTALPQGMVFPGSWNRWTVSDWHRQTVGDGVKDTHGNETKGLDVPLRLPLRQARHHYAVRMLRAGTPVELVAESLGSSKEVVHRHYGQFIPSAGDRAKWDRKASADDRKRKKAK